MAGYSKTKISLVTTVYNEESSIQAFLNSIKNQTIKPSEVIIIDAGSKDETIKLTKRFEKENKKLNLKLFLKKGNRSVGRNEAIKRAKNKIIAVSDAGCILDKNWLKEINIAFKKDVDVVAGYYKPIAINAFEKSLAAYTCVMPDKVSPEEFLPSSRSIAFKKNAWKTVGGYSEDLNTCEDLVFSKKLKDFGFKFNFAKKAFVYWPQRKNLGSAFMQFFGYALGDGKARYFRKNSPFLFARYIVGLILLAWTIFFKSTLVATILVVLFLIYLLWSVRKNYKYVANSRAFFYLPTLQLISDLAVLAGTTIGFFQSLKVSNKSTN